MNPSTSHQFIPSELNSSIRWEDAARQTLFQSWLKTAGQIHLLSESTLRSASADASFRRYFRIDDSLGQSFIIMDAPPEKEDCKPFVRVSKLMSQAGVLVPEILNWDEAHGFMLLTDLGAKTMMEVINPHLSDALAQPRLDLFLQAIDALIAWQLASKPDVLPLYDEALMQRELSLFTEWYLGKYKQKILTPSQQTNLEQTFKLIVQHNLATPSVYVHRDFMPRNLMVTQRNGISSMGVLDFQDAVYGPITYDMASLMRDAFVSWDESFVLDVTIRYWEKAIKVGLLGANSPSGWGADFGEFYRAVEWQALQRHLKVLGIFARLTLRDGKPKYLADTPRFINYVRKTAARYRELGPFLKLIDDIEGITAETGYAFGKV